MHSHIVIIWSYLPAVGAGLRGQIITISFMLSTADNYCDSNWLSNRGEYWNKPCNLCVLRSVSELSVCSGDVRVVERSVRNRKRVVRQHGRDFWTLGSQLQLSSGGFSIYRSTGLVRSQTRFKPQRHTSQKQVRMATHFRRRCVSFQMQLES